MELKKLGQSAVRYWLFKYILYMLVIAIPVLAGCLGLTTNNLQIIIPFIIVPYLLVFVWVVVYQFLKYNCYSFGYDNERIVITKGVIFKHKILVPVCQIQDLHTVQGPFMMLFGICGVIISTAGSNFFIPCVNKAFAKTMIEELETFLKKRLEGKSYEKI